MAKKKRKAVKRQSKDSPIAVRVEIEAPEGTPAHYINFIEVTHNKWDFTLIAGRLPPPKYSPSQVAQMGETGILTLPAEATLTIPPTLIAGLIRALIDQKTKFETENEISLEEKNDDGPSNS